MEKWRHAADLHGGAVCALQAHRADELVRKYDPQMLSSLAFIRSPDGVLLTSLEARMSEWEENANSE